MRIGIVNIWHDDNRGDSAIALATYRLLEEVFPHAVIEFWSLSDHSRLPQAHRVLTSQINDIQVHPAFLPAHQGRSGTWRYGLTTVIGVVRAVIGLLWPPLNPHPVRALTELDLMVASGGHYLHSQPGLRWAIRTFRLLHPLLVAGRAGVPYALVGHSLGPFDGRFSRWLTARVLSGAVALQAREEPSAHAAVELGVPQAQITIVPDSAFATIVDGDGLDARLARHGLTPGRFWVVTVRRSPRGTEDERRASTQRFLGELARFIRTSLGSGRIDRIALVPHVVGPTAIEDDRDPTLALAASLADCDGVVTIDEDFSPGSIAALYGAAELVIGTRFHSVILSLVAGTPAYAISYFGPKAAGIMTMAGMSDSYTELEDFSADTLTAWVNAVDLSAERDAVRKVHENFERRLRSGLAELRESLG